MGGEERVQRRRPDLLLTFDQDANVARKRAGARQPRADRVRMCYRAGLVVGGAPPVETAVPLLGLERIARPVLDDPRRLDVVMRVQQNGREFRPGVQPLADDERLRSFDARGAHILQPVRAQELDGRVRARTHVGMVVRVGADTRYANE